VIEPNGLQPWQPSVSHTTSSAPAHDLCGIALLTRRRPKENNAEEENNAEACEYSTQIGIHDRPLCSSLI
jgi:hypothetical protein